MEFIERALESEWFIRLVGTLVLALVGYLQTTRYWQKAKEHKLDLLYNVARAAVEETYTLYIRKIKEDRADGTLTDTERTEAQELALSRLKEIAADQGIKALRVASDEILRSLINQAVGDIKSERQLPKRERASGSAASQG